MRALPLVLRLSAAYDLVAAALLLWMPMWLLELWRHPVPAEPFLFRLSALPLLLLPPVYLAAASTAAGRPELVRLCVLIRGLGGAAILLLVLWQRPAAPGPYLCFAIVDWLWAGAYLAAGRTPGRHSS
jgi:hypothetical protein